MLNDFEIKKIEELKDRSEEQDEKLFKLRKRLAGLRRVFSDTPWRQGIMEKKDKVERRIQDPL